ncbi:uncharacterized protein LOC111704453 [Eurytemora carolleeae]|uniref:uncharacterized protein LOC111704453 n=1 Tax=Eurytemora carolleeae TaxID=1294199 RepID=UPI000C75F1D8|nr:uncharacterized protein LOC111704453 [Eurytemora carolleeae]|eukprot:XP_023332454.1 uncharacterized protein LOC111704453 [Eurytemora affinis]
MLKHRGACLHLVQIILINLIDVDPAHTVISLWYFDGSYYYPLENSRNEESQKVTGPFQFQPNGGLSPFKQTNGGKRVYLPRSQPVDPPNFNQSTLVGVAGPFEPTKNGGMAPVLQKESEKVQTRMGTISVENPKGPFEQSKNGVVAPVLPNQSNTPQQSVHGGP